MISRVQAGNRERGGWNFDCVGRSDIHPTYSSYSLAFHMGSKVVAIIPARYESSRLPGKALAVIDGKPMVQHVYERTRAIAGVSRTLVATDDERIADTVKKFGGE